MCSNQTIKGNKKCSVWWRSVLLCCAQSYTWIWTQCGACSERSGLQEAPSAPPGVEWKAAKRRASVRQTGCLCLTFSIQMSFNFIVLRRVYEAENEPIWLWNQISVTNNKSNNTSDCQRARQQQHWLQAEPRWRRSRHRRMTAADSSDELRLTLARTASVSSAGPGLTLGSESWLLLASDAVTVQTV